jgi:quercetin dioxygenase-like cupin family protein
MNAWDLAALDVQPHHPEVVHSSGEGRAIVIDLPAGERLDEHQVHEGAWLVVTSGEVEVRDAMGETASGGIGLLVQFAPNERRAVRAVTHARLLLLLTPWPGDGHPSERAREDPKAIGTNPREERR